MFDLFFEHPRSDPQANVTITQASDFAQLLFGLLCFKCRFRSTVHARKFRAPPTDLLSKVLYRMVQRIQFFSHASQTLRQAVRVDGAHLLLKFGQGHPFGQLRQAFFLFGDTLLQVLFLKPELFSGLEPLLASAPRQSAQLIEFRLRRLGSSRCRTDLGFGFFDRIPIGLQPGLLFAGTTQQRIELLDGLIDRQ